eukprot:539003-Pleurochrysis_carterae.AAC.1
MDDRLPYHLSRVAGQSAAHMSSWLLSCVHASHVTSILLSRMASYSCTLAHQISLRFSFSPSRPPPATNALHLALVTFMLSHAASAAGGKRVVHAGAAAWSEAEAAAACERAAAPRAEHDGAAAAAAVHPAPPPPLARRTPPRPLQRRAGLLPRVVPGTRAHFGACNHARTCSHAHDAARLPRPL